MSLSHEQIDSFLNRGFSRRQVGRIAGVLTAGASLPFYNEYAMAQQAERRMMRGRRNIPPDAVRITSNENPMGPAPEAVEAIHKVAKWGWRYSPFGEAGDFVSTMAAVEGVKEEYITPFAGSSDPLHRTICAFASPTASMVMGDPGYGGGTGAYNVDRPYQWGDTGAALYKEAWNAIDIESWLTDIGAMLPSGLEIWKGVDYDFENPWSGLVARTALWRADDGNCCPTGGSAVITFDIVDRALVATGVTYSPPAPPQ